MLNGELLTLTQLIISRTRKRRGIKCTVKRTCSTYMLSPYNEKTLSLCNLSLKTGRIQLSSRRAADFTAAEGREGTSDPAVRQHTLAGIGRQLYCDKRIGIITSFIC